MFLLIEGGEVHAPEPMGALPVLVAGDRIAKVGPVDGRALAALGLDVEVIDARGCVVVPGLLDPHEHLLGGSGERGFASQTPEIALREVVTAGITTVVGCLGVDTTTKTMTGLLAKAKAFKEEGLSAYIYSGGYDVPPTTITDTPRNDILFIEEVIGAGEIAISDLRSTEPDFYQLAHLVHDAYVGGMLSKKAGVTHFHVGETETRLKLLHQLVDEFHTPPQCIYASHVERNKKLMRDAITLTRSGCFVDLDTAGEDVSEYICFYFDNDADPEQLTLSSDAGLTSPSNLLDQIRSARERGCIEFPRLLALVTKNTAKVLKLQDKGELAGGKAADVLVLDADSLGLKEVIAGGKRLFRDGRLDFRESYLEKSNRVINLVGAEA